MGVAAKRTKGEKLILSELLKEALRALPLIGSAAGFGDCVVPHLFHPDDEVAQACALSVQRLFLFSPTDRAPFLRRFVNFIRRLSPEHDVQLMQSAVSHLLALVDLCLVAPFVDPHAAPRSRRKMTMFEVMGPCADSTIAPELEALALLCLCNPLSAVRVDALALLDAAGHAYPPAPTSAMSPTSRWSASGSSASSCPSSLPSPAMLLLYPTHVATQALSTLLSEAWPCNEHPLPELRSWSLTLVDLAQSEAPMLWVHVLRRLALLVADSRSLVAIRSQLIDAAQQLLTEADSSERAQQSSFGVMLRANLSALMLALPQDGSSISSDAISRCASSALAALGAESETGLLDIYSAVLGGTHADCISQLMHSVSGWYSTDFARFGQKRKTRARQVLCGAFRRLVSGSSFATALQRGREPLTFLVSFASGDEAIRPVTWDALQQLCEVTSLLAALASAYAAPLCELSTGALRVQLKTSVANDKTWPVDQRCKLLKALHSSANALQDSAVVNGLIEKAEAQRREQKDTKVKAAARRQVDAALVRVQMAAWRATEAVLRLGSLGGSKVEEVCDEQFMTWCLAGERSGVPILRWLLAHHWPQFYPRFSDRCYVPADTAPLFVRALLEQYISPDSALLSDEQRRALEAVPLSADDSAFAKRTFESAPQLLALFLQETGASEVDIRSRAIGVIARLATTQLGKSDGSSAPEVSQLMRTHATALASPHVTTWRTATRKVLSAVAASIATAVATPLLQEIIARWRYVSSARREWLLEALLPYASALRIGSLSNAADFLRRLMSETVLSAPLPLSPALSALWLALLTAPDNCAHVCTFLISCGSEARHLCEASRALLVDLYCSAPEMVAPQLTERLTCDSILQLLAHASGSDVQDAFVQREVVCDILVEVATSAPAALSLYLPVLIAYALPRIDSAECMAARRLLGRICEVSLVAVTDQKQEAALRSFGAKLTDARAPLELWWQVESSLLEPALVFADVLAPNPSDNTVPSRSSCVSAVEVLKAMISVLTPLQLDSLGSQLLGWSLRYQDLPLALRTQELFLTVLQPLDALIIDSHLCALQEILGELERMPQPSALPKPTDLLFAQRRTKAQLVLRALQVAVSVTNSAEVLRKLFWCVASVLDVPSLPFVPILGGLLPLLTSIVRHPMWHVAEQQAIVTLGMMGADFEGLVWPVLKALCGVRTEHSAFTLLCSLLELQVARELLVRPSSSLSHLSASLATLPWLACALTRSASSPAPRLFGRALASHKDAAELSQLLSGGEVKADSLFKSALAVLPLSVTLFDEAAPLLARLGAYAPPHMQPFISRLCRALLSDKRAGTLYLDAAQQVLRVAVVNTTPSAFEALVPVYGRALRMYTKDRDEISSPSDALPVNFQLPKPLAEQPAQSRGFVLSSRLTRLIEAMPALAAQANAHQNLTLRQRNAAKSVLSEADERALLELRRVAAQHSEAAAAVEPSDLAELQELLSPHDSTGEMVSVPKLSLGTSESMVRLVQEANEVVLDDTREPDEEDTEADDVGMKDDADKEALDALIKAAERNFKGFDMCALAEATAALANLTGSQTNLFTAV